MKFYQNDLKKEEFEEKGVEKSSSLNFFVVRSNL